MPLFDSLRTAIVLRKLSAIVIGIMSASQILLNPVEAADQATKVYRLRANQGIVRQEEGPSLKRDDVGSASDPFENKRTDADSTLEAPSSAFEIPSKKRTAAPKKEFNLNVNDGGEFGGQALPGIEEQLPFQEKPGQQTMPPNLAPPTQLNQHRQPSNDANAQEQLAWDEWHKRVAGAIYDQISTAARSAIPKSEPLVCVVNYTVTKDGRVININFQQNSSSLIYNGMVYAVLNGMGGNPVLQFPHGSRRITVDKLSTFSHNVGDRTGYQFITGDKETMKQGKR